MKHRRTIRFFTVVIALLATLATLTAILSDDGNGAFTFQSIYGEQVLIYGKGLYKYMSAEVAPQGLAQDYITLFLGVPFLLIAAFSKDSVRNRILFGGITGYFLVTYLFYMTMAMYNILFPVYIILCSLSFYQFMLIIKSFKEINIQSFVLRDNFTKPAGIFLNANALCIGLLWISILIKPYADGKAIPVEVAHYTTLIVQAFDLAILLPGAMICGYQLIRKTNAGILYASIYLVFLGLLMTALTAKVIAMKAAGYPVIPVIYIIPSINVFSIVFATMALTSISASRLNTVK